MKRNLILLAVGVVLSLLFVGLAPSTYEALYYEREFSNEMYNGSMYIVMAIIQLAIAWGVAAAYYYIVDSVSFSRWYHWLVLLAVVAVVAGGGGYGYPNAVFSDLGFDFTFQQVAFALVCMLIEVVLFVIASFSIRWWSVNCRHTPIPE